MSNYTISKLQCRSDIYSLCIKKYFINYLVNKAFCDDLMPNMKILAHSVIVSLDNTNG